MNIDNHPCFNDKARHRFGRIHLPVAPRCNIQCRFCNRKFDCVNESRPGVTSGILSPHGAMAFLEAALKRNGNISVVGIAGPGDPFANPAETLQTLALVRERYPEMLLCVASNGLNLAEHARTLAGLRVSHLTVTVNAVDPEIGEKIYAWVRPDRRVLRAEEGVSILMERQQAAISTLKSLGVTVKVNTIIIPGVNDGHIPAVAERMAELGVDILNCVAYYPNKGAAFSHIEEPSPELVARVRREAAKFIPQMHHCTRCRADAVGLLGQPPDPSLVETLRACEAVTGPPEPAAATPGRPHVAVASMEGVLVNQHLGEADDLLIYGRDGDGITLVDRRRTPAPGGGDVRWESLGRMLGDCGTLLVSGIGKNPRQVLSRDGLRIMEVEGVIEEAVRAVFQGEGLGHMTVRRRACGDGCSGSAMGCG